MGGWKRGAIGVAAGWGLTSLTGTLENLKRHICVSTNDLAPTDIHKDAVHTQNRVVC